MMTLIKLPNGKEIRNFRFGGGGEVSNSIKMLKKGYLRMTVDYKGEFSDSFLLVENGRIKGAYRYSKGEVLFGKEAFVHILDDLKKEPFISVVELSQIQFDMIKEYFPQVIIENGASIPSTIGREKTVKREDKKVQERDIKEKVEKMDKVDSREEILKKYHIREPSEEEVNAVLMDFLFNVRGIEDIVKNVESGIKKELKEKIPKIKKSRVSVDAERERNSLVLNIKIEAAYSGGIRKKRDKYLEEKMREDIEKICRKVVEEMCKDINVKTDINYEINFKVKGFI